MSDVMTPHIICGKCGSRHASVFEVKLCYGQVVVKQCFATMAHGPHQAGSNWCPGLRGRPAAVEQKAVAMVTGPQLDYIRRLGGDVSKAQQYTMALASKYIDELKRNPPVSIDPQWAAPNRQTTKVPIEMLKAVEDGYYAVQPDSTTPHTFFRISRPKSGNYRGQIKVQTQHGPELKMCMVVRANDSVYVWDKSVEDQLLLVVVDQRGAAIEYAEKIGKCMRCNTELTDERSRWYGIGPECEKHWPWAVPEQIERKGEYVPGAGS